MMPTYCYRSDNNVVIEKFFRMGEALEVLTLEDGTSARRDFQSEHVSGQMVGTENPVAQSAKPNRPWPMTCYASGVHPEQAGELRGHFKKHGLNIEVNNNGDPVYESAAQRKKALKCRGIHDNASFS